jgi:hypothetical protein
MSPNSPTTAGTRAERIIQGMLREAHCQFRTQVDAGESIYGTGIRADVLITNLIEFPNGVVLESKWQDITGTVEQKFPYVVWNIRNGCYRYPVIVVLGGDGFTPGAVDWLRRQVDGTHLVAVFRWEELQSWLLRQVHVRPPSSLSL